MYKTKSPFLDVFKKQPLISNCKNREMRLNKREPAHGHPLSISSSEEDQNIYPICQLLNICSISPVLPGLLWFAFCVMSWPTEKHHYRRLKNKTVLYHDPLS